MKPQDKQAYLEEYELLKKKGKPFFPYAVMKDSVMALIVVAVIIAMSLILGAEQGPKADPTSTTYVPRPEWYFFFLFELLRIIKPAYLVPLATIGIPTICMVLLLLLPFYDRGPERRPERRPIATTAGIFTIIMLSLILGAELGPKADPTTTTYVPRPEWYFFFLFELLRVIKPSSLTPMATIGVPTICMILLLLLPFYDRGPERRPERRPLATTAGLLTIVAMAYLTYLGASAGSPNEI
ncbi:MAG TPA: hypothetical protein VMS60_01060, partial [Solirubrobacterales bacterium]|nr:hypothetical protein [Solirubrobacterales bacterium]